MSIFSNSDSSQAFDIEEMAMQIISYAGEGKFKVRAAVEAFANGDDATYIDLMDQAEKEFTEAYRAQVSYLQQQAIRQDANTHILLVHAMDILMNAMNERELLMTLFKTFQARGLLK